MAIKDQKPIKPGRLIVPRKEAAQMLGGVDLSTVRRLEKQGLLKPIRLMRSPTAQVFYSYDNVIEVAQGQAMSPSGDTPEPLIVDGGIVLEIKPSRFAAFDDCKVFLGEHASVQAAMDAIARASAVKT